MIWFILFVLLVRLESFYINHRGCISHMQLGVVEYRTVPQARREKINKYAQFSKKAVVTTPNPAEETRNKLEEEANMKLESNTIESVVDELNFDPIDPFQSGFCEIGTIGTAHGVRGEVKVEFQTDFVKDRLKPGTTLYIKNPHGQSPRPMKVVSGRKQIDDIYLVKLEGVVCRTMAGTLRGYKIYVKLTDRPALENDEYLVHDLVNMLCYLVPTQMMFSSSSSSPSSLLLNYSTIITTTQPFARVSGIVLPQDYIESRHAEYANQLHGMLEIQLFPPQSPSSSSSALLSQVTQSIANQPAEYCLIPFVKDIVPFVDQMRHSLVLTPPEGLLELTYTHEEDKASTNNPPRPAASSLLGGIGSRPRKSRSNNNSSSSSNRSRRVFSAAKE